MSVLVRFSLKGKNALVTGGAGLYGRQIAQALAQASATTVMASRDLPRLEQAAAEYQREGLAIHALRLDQGEEASILEARDQWRERYGELHVLVNNAVARPVKKGVFSPAESFDESFHINGTGLILVTRAFGEMMVEGGSIINIGSIMGLVGVEPANYRGTDMDGRYPDYFFHKGGMANLTRFWASYYGPRGIRVNCLHPGGL